MALSFWGLLGGGGLGFALGGPLGALIGAVAGHVLIDQEGGKAAGKAALALIAPPREIIFTTGLIALAAKMARSDGVVHDSEVAAFRRIVDVPPEEEARAQALFDLAKSTTDGFEAYARQIAEAFREEPALLADVMDGLFHIAAADGAVHEAERAYLMDVATIFGIDEAGFAAIEARHARLPDDPYAVLGVSPDIDDAALKARHRQLVRDNHPDREMARGLPPEAVKIATERLAAINAAYDRIQSLRAGAS
jgi:DnaJ like chaperone protein